jgi:hypothetical protein
MAVSKIIHAALARPTVLSIPYIDDISIPSQRVNTILYPSLFIDYKIGDPIANLAGRDKDGLKKVLQLLERIDLSVSQLDSMLKDSHWQSASYKIEHVSETHDDFFTSKAMIENKQACLITEYDVNNNGIIDVIRYFAEKNKMSGSLISYDINEDSSPDYIRYDANGNGDYDEGELFMCDQKDMILQPIFQNTFNYPLFLQYIYFYLP